VAVTETPRVEIGEEAERWAAEWFDAWRPETADRSGREPDASWPARRPPLAMCPGARHATKRWPERHWMALHERLANAGHPLLYLATREDRKLFPALLSYAEQDGRARWVEEGIARVAALLGRCPRAVTSDSGLMHLAAARGARVVALFGSTAPELGFAPAGAGHVVLCRHEPCQPCTLHGRPECPKGHFRCMNELLPESVVRALDATGVASGTSESARRS
jgi:heptosyltransferase-2